MEAWQTCRLLLVVAISLTSAPPVVAQDPDPMQEFEACARIPDRSARIACFEELGERVLGEEEANATESAPEPVAAPASEPAAMIDVEAPPPEPVSAQPAADEPADADVPEVVENKESVAVTDAPFTGRVTSCEKGHYGNWYFIFEDGQIWRDTNRKNLRLETCDFNATITKDLFGYKLQIEGEEDTVRVRRYR